MESQSDYRIEKWIALFLSFLFFLPFVAHAQQQPVNREHPVNREQPVTLERPVTLGQVGSATLLIETSRRGIYLEAPAVETKISLDVRGIVARGTVRQRFTNPTDRCVEALYAFPLPDGAAVDWLTMTVGGRRIVGKIQEREEAKKTYEAAKSAGQQASLLEEHRPNLFTVSIAALPAGETAEIEIAYQQTLTWDAGRFSLRFPLAIGPRYTPGGSAPLPAAAHAHAPTSARRNPVTIEAEVDAGIALQSIDSTTHRVNATQLSGTRWRVSTADPQIASDRDFELTWSPRLGTQPQATVFTEERDGERYSLMMVFPPAAKSVGVVPREVVFIIDTSGSMTGESMEQARAALLIAIDRLRASDRFNVIEFDDDATALFADSVPADRTAIEKATSWVRGLAADGGTEMLPALQIALRGDDRGDGVRQVIFMTDGQVGNEDQLYAYIRQHLGNSRLFTIGIGAAPNAYFMRNAARFGRGTYTFVADTATVAQKMGDLFVKLESPVLSGIDIELDDRHADIWPPRIPDLYAGEPLIVTARSARATKRVHFRAATDGWNTAVDLAPEAEQGGIARLWARQKIESLIDEATLAGNPDAVKPAVVPLALAHHLVTRYTSLVAVDETPANARTTSCEAVAVPINLPAGWGGGALPQGGTMSTLLMLIGLALAFAAWVISRQ